MRLRDKLAFFGMGCAFVVAGQVVTGVLAPDAEAQNTPGISFPRVSLDDAAAAQIGRYQLVVGAYKPPFDGSVVESSALLRLDTATGDVVFFSGMTGRVGEHGNKWSALVP